MEDNKQSGVIKFFNPKKGFGFICITTQNGTKDIFFHISALNNDCKDNLNEGDKVSCFIVKGQKGFEALRVSLDNE